MRMTVRRPSQREEESRRELFATCALRLAPDQVTADAVKRHYRKDERRARPQVWMQSHPPGWRGCAGIEAGNLSRYRRERRDRNAEETAKTGLESRKRLSCHSSAVNVPLEALAGCEAAGVHAPDRGL
jgi:hypothetical protein